MIAIFFFVFGPTAKEKNSSQETLRGGGLREVSDTNPLVTMAMELDLSQRVDWDEVDPSSNEMVKITTHFQLQIQST